MEKYNLEVRHTPFPNEQKALEDPAIESMWELFRAIGRHWGGVDSPEAWKSHLLVFMQNRILLNQTYRSYYRGAMETVEELKREKGAAAYEFLFTNKGANLFPPTSKLGFTRQYVSNEFITLYLALGGFRTFGGATNYMGYFGGANLPGHPPYRVYEG